MYYFTSGIFFILCVIAYATGADCPPRPAVSIGDNLTWSSWKRTKVREKTKNKNGGTKKKKKINQQLATGSSSIFLRSSTSSSSFFFVLLGKRRARRPSTAHALKSQESSLSFFWLLLLFRDKLAFAETTLCPSGLYFPDSSLLWGIKKRIFFLFFFVKTMIEKIVGFGNDKQFDSGGGG